MAIGIIVDAPDIMFGTTEEWTAFLDEMKLVKAQARDVDTLIELDQQIKRAERVLAERRMTGSQ